MSVEIRDQDRRVDENALADAQALLEGRAVQDQLSRSPRM
jgi:hypothetical protein